MTAIHIRNARLIDPSASLDASGEVLVTDGKIAQVGTVNNAPKDAAVIDAAGCMVTPGLIDPHVHLREPGDQEQETIASGAAAAVAGGFTAVACMPNTDPALDNEASVDFVYRQAAAAGLAHVYPVGAVTIGRAGKEMAEIGQMVRGGAVAFSDDGTGVQNPAMIRLALSYARMFDKPILEHCEDAALAGTGCMNAGYYATILGLPGMNPLAEELMLYRDIQLAKQANSRLHAQHLSTAGSVAIVRAAKADGVRVTAEVTPHHLLFTEQDCMGYDTNFKMNPPLRRTEDIAALRAGVADGTIDCLATDHAPHTASAKELEFLYAPCGIIALDCALGLYVEALIDNGTIDWPALIAMMTINPARLLGIDKGTLVVGADADITIIDPDTPFTVDVNTFRSRARNCPYHGRKLHARATHTIVGGKVVYSP